jgi:hypothetical protein
MKSLEIGDINTMMIMTMNDSNPQLKAVLNCKHQLL